jgi:hypothetical protein
MVNEDQGTRIHAKIYTTRGEITIHCDGDSNAGYRYRPLDKLDPYSHGPINNRSQIRERLRESWIIDPTQETIVQIEAARDFVENANNEDKV